MLHITQIIQVKFVSMHHVMLLSNNRCRDRGNFSSLELIKKKEKEKRNTKLFYQETPFLFFLLFFFKNIEQKNKSCSSGRSLFSPLNSSVPLISF